MSDGTQAAPTTPTAIVSAPNGGNGPPRLMKTRLDEIDVELVPDRLKAELRTVPTDTAADRVNKLWHTVTPPKGIAVRITSCDTKHRLLRLSVECDDINWRGNWIKWRYAVRKTPELLGGDAVDAQDVLAPSGAQLKLLIAPGETREATIEVVACLDGDTAAGDYLFDVVVEDITGGENNEVPATTRSGILSLRHPPSQLLDELPSIYREALYPPEEATFGYREPEFFERYLLGFEDFLDRLSATLDNLEKLFGPYSTPPDFLLWLGAWVCMPLDENWPEMKQRQLIREAVELFRWRGTRRGLSRYLRIYTGVTPEINDKPFKGMRLGPHAKLGTDETILGDVPEHTFVVTLSVPEGSEVDETIVHRIIRYEKPAHTAYTLNMVTRAPSVSGPAESPPVVRVDAPTDGVKPEPVEVIDAPLPRTQEAITLAEDIPTQEGEASEPEAKTPAPDGQPAAGTEHAADAPPATPEDEPAQEGAAEEELPAPPEAEPETPETQPKPKPKSSAKPNTTPKSKKKSSK